MAIASRYRIFPSEVKKLHNKKSDIPMRNNF